MKFETYYRLFSCCIAVKGSRRSSIYDNQRRKIYFIPNSLFNLFNNEDRAFCIFEVEKELNDENLFVFKDYLNFLEANELAFKCEKDELKNFPPINENFLFPAHISHCIIDSNGSLDFLTENFISQLEEVSCNHIQIRFFYPVDFDEIERMVTFLMPTQMKTIELVFEYPSETSVENRLLQFVISNRKIRNIVVYNAPQDKILIKNNTLTGSVYLTTEKITGELHCGIVQFEQFSLSITHYTESLHHNTCLNRKIGIDTDGNIKNCPSMKESYGNIRDTTLKEAMEKPGFKKYWNITKDQIAVCKDCEFRHVCTDCRAYREEPENEYSKPLKCGYNPYSCEWEQWSTSPLKQYAINYYGMREIISNKE